MTLLDQVHISLSVFTAFFAVSAFFIARDAMRKGLTYECIVAALWGLGFVMIGRLWHAFFQALQLTIVWSNWPETIEYFIYLIAYAVFARLMWKGYQIRTPHRAFKKGK